jgi:hypothetical protein
LTRADHLESHLPEIHDRMVKSRGAWKQTVAGLENALDSPLFVMTNTTMLTDNSPQLPGTLQYLANLGVPTVGLNALIYSGRALPVLDWKSTIYYPCCRLPGRSPAKRAAPDLVHAHAVLPVRPDAAELGVRPHGCPIQYSAWSRTVVIPANRFTGSSATCSRIPGGIWNHELRFTCANGVTCRKSARPAL